VTQSGHLATIGPIDRVVAGPEFFQLDFATGTT
jgi:hypothetical protein